MADGEDQQRDIAAFYSRVAASYDQVGPAAFREAVDTELPALAQTGGYHEVWRVRCVLASKPAA